MNMPKVIKRGILILASLTVAYFAWHTHATSRLESALEEARAQNVPLTMADLIQGRPAAGNAASHMYAAAISACKAAGDVSELALGYEPFGEEGQNAQLAEVPAELRAALPDFAEGIALLQSAGEMGECYFPMVTGESLEERISDWDAMGTLDLSRLLVAAARVQMDEGDLEAAKVAVEANLALTTAHRHEPTMVVQLVGIITANYAARSAMLLASQLDDPAEWLASLHLLAGTEPGASTPLIAEALASDLPFITQALAGGGASANQPPSGLFAASDMALPGEWPITAGPPYMRSAQASFIEYVTASVTIARAPLHKAIGQADALAEEARDDSNSLVGAFVINASPMLQNYAASLAQTRLLLLGSKAYAHRAETGAWPTDIASLGLSDLVDPRTGTPYELSQTGTKLTLMSQGPDSVEWVLD